MVATHDSKEPFLDPQGTAPALPTTGSSSPGLPSSTSRLFAIRHMVHKFWIIEALSGGFALTVFVGIITLMWTYDGHTYGTASMVAQTAKMERLPIFPILALLSAIMRGAMLLPVATALGQLKWSWFRTSNRLADLERFDEASRGITGSLVLLWTVRFRHLAAIGAALTILALPIDAIIQSSIYLPQEKIVNQIPYTRQDNGSELKGITKFPRTSAYNESQSMESTSQPWATSSMINAIKFGVAFQTGLGDAISANATVNCPTGYCEFGRYQTLGVSALCLDRSDDIQRGEDNYGKYLFLPSAEGLKLYNRGIGNFSEMFIASKVYEDYDKTIFHNYPLPLIARTVILSDLRNTQGSGVVLNGSAETENPVAIECALYWEVKTRTAHVDRAQGPFLKENAVEVAWSLNEIEGSPYQAFELSVSECWLDNQTLTRDTDPILYEGVCVYSIGQQGHSGIQALLLDETDGFVGNSSVKSYNEDGVSVKNWTRTNHFITNIYELMPTPYDAYEAYDAVESRDKYVQAVQDLFWNTAIFMTHVVRRGLDDRDGTRNVTTGQVYTYVFVYRIEWRRMAFPAVIIAGSVLFVITTAIFTVRQHAWRRSTLPLLFHGFGEEERRNCGNILRLADMEGIAMQMNMKIHDSEEGTRLVGVPERTGFAP